LRLAAKQEISFDALDGKNVLVVGGSGRVGGSVVTQLLKRGSAVTVGGTSVDSFLAAQQRWHASFPNLPVDDVQFQALDREEEQSVASVLQRGSYDM